MKTENGIEYTERYYTPNGVAVNLYTRKSHTKEDIKKAKKEIRNTLDVVKFYMNGKI